jgi:RNA polymerase sigma-54 factor
MRLDLRTTQRQEQRMLPQMLQSIEVLQLATADLLDLVAQEVAGNEVLEILPTKDDGVPATSANGEGESGVAEDGDRKRAFLESQPAPVDSLVEHIREQLLFRELPNEVIEAVLTVTALLDSRGLLPVPPAELALFAGLDAGLAARALSELRTLEPAGLAACSGVEAMLAQAVGDPDFPVIERLLTEHLDSLSRNKLPEVARAVRLGIDELMVLIERIATLDPSPASRFANSSEPGITPDVHAWVDDAGAVQVALADGRLPQLAIDQSYSNMVADKGLDRTVRDYLRQKVRTARDLIAALELRQATLLGVARAVMQHQRDFLVGGRRCLQPLRMSQVADELGMHTSTVSRALAGKYVATDHGTMRLRDFFDGARENASGANRQGRGAIAQRIADLVAAEDATAPLSDDDLCAALKSQGVHIARRTVAKFRGELGIASSYQRKRFPREE